MANKELYDWTSFTESSSTLSLFGHMIRWGLAPEEYSDSTTFKARALSDSFELPSNRAMAIDGGATSATGGSEPRVAFKARIIGENSPHSFLPNPCDPTWAGDESETWRIIEMHTTFLSAITAKGSTPVTRGDIVLVNLQRSGQAYNLEYGTFEELVSVENPSPGAMAECVALVTLFGQITNKPLGSLQGDGPAGAAWDGKMVPLAPFVPGTAIPPCPSNRKGYCENSNCQSKANPNAPPDHFMEIAPGNGNYRGATVTSKQQMQLMRDTFGVRIVISLAVDAAQQCGGVKCTQASGQRNASVKPCEAYWAEELDMKWYQVVMHSSRHPNTEEWSRIHSDLNSGNVYFHCAHGVDRTGAIAAKWKRVNKWGAGDAACPADSKDKCKAEIFAYTKKQGGAWRSTAKWCKDSVKAANGGSCPKDADAVKRATTGGVNWVLYDWMFRE